LLILWIPVIRNFCCGLVIGKEDRVSLNVDPEFTCAVEWLVVVIAGDIAAKVPFEGILDGVEDGCVIVGGRDDVATVIVPCEVEFVGVGGKVVLMVAEDNAAALCGVVFTGGNDTFP